MEELEDSSLEEEFEEEKGRRSLASIFDSEDDEVLEVDAAMEDDSLKVCCLMLFSRGVAVVEIPLSRGVTRFIF